MTETEQIEIERVMRMAFATALEVSHRGGQAQLHVGQDVWDWMQAEARRVREDVGLPSAFEPKSTAWGFPVIRRDDAAPDMVAVHSVQVIV